MLIKMFSDKMKINYGSTVCTVCEVILLLETEMFQAFFSRICLLGLKGVP